MNDGLRASKFTITTARRCAAEGCLIAGAFLLVITRRDGEQVGGFVVESTQRMLDLYRDLAPAVIDFHEADDEHSALPSLLGADAARSH